MDALLGQLGLDKTFFIELAIFAGLFVILSKVYFKPFLRLFEARHKKTVEDREASEKLLAQAQSKLEEYNRQIAQERQAIKKDFDQILAEAKKQESEILAEAREEAKKITHEAADSINQQREYLRRQLEVDVESVARNISERLLSRKV